MLLNDGVLNKGVLIERLLNDGFQDGEGRSLKMSAGHEIKTKLGLYLEPLIASFCLFLKYIFPRKLRV